MNRNAHISGFEKQQSKNIQTELLIEPFHSFFSVFVSLIMQINCCGLFAVLCKMPRNMGSHIPFMRVFGNETKIGILHLLI